MSFLFSVTCNCFQFYFSSNVSIDLLHYSNLIIHQRARSLFRDPESRVPLEHFGFLGHGSHQEGPEPRVSYDDIGVLGHGSYLWGPGSQDQGSTFPVCRILDDNDKFQKSGKRFTRSAFHFYKNTKLSIFFRLPLIATRCAGDEVVLIRYKFRTT